MICFQRTIILPLLLLFILNISVCIVNMADMLDSSCKDDLSFKNIVVIFGVLTWGQSKLSWNGAWSVFFLSFNPVSAGMVGISSKSSHLFPSNCSHKLLGRRVIILMLLMLAAFRKMPITKNKTEEKRCETLP